MSSSWRREEATDPYGYKDRRGVRTVSWEVVHGLCKGLARAAAKYEPQIILAVARGGAYPGMLMAHMQVEAYTVRVSRRLRDLLTYASPVWFQRPPLLVRGQRVLIVDELCSTGQTLTLVRSKVLEMGAAAVRTAVLYAHLRGEAIPDYIGFVSDELILNPWDRQILRDRQFILHPQYVEALRAQGREPSEELLIDAPEIAPYKAAGMAPAELA